jgi:hypothetical protein
MAREMDARFNSVCPLCKQYINKGDRINYTPGRPGEHVVCPMPTQAPLPEAPARVRIAIEDAGVYLLPDGTICKVQANLDKTRTYAKRWIDKSTGPRITEAEIDRILAGESRDKVLKGKELPHGDYQFEAGLVQQVAAEGRKMTLEEAKRFIVVYGKCARCSTTLKAAKSVDRGIGPRCIKFFPAGTTGDQLLAGREVVDAERRAVDDAPVGEDGVSYDTQGHDSPASDYPPKRRKRTYDEIFGDTEAPSEKADPSKIAMDMLRNAEAKRASTPARRNARRSR